MLTRLLIFIVLKLKLKSLNLSTLGAIRVYKNIIQNHSLNIIESKIYCFTDSNHR